MAKPCGAHQDALAAAGGGEVADDLEDVRPPPRLRGATGALPGQPPPRPGRQPGPRCDGAGAGGQLGRVRVADEDPLGEGVGREEDLWSSRGSAARASVTARVRGSRATPARRTSGRCAIALPALGRHGRRRAGVWYSPTLAGREVGGQHQADDDLGDPAPASSRRGVLDERRRRASGRGRTRHRPGARSSSAAVMRDPWAAVRAASGDDAAEGLVAPCSSASWAGSGGRPRRMWV